LGCDFLFLNMLELEDALKVILEAIPSPDSESIALGEAAGRILAERVCAPMDLPAFDNSAMDGFAVRSSDLVSANANNPVRLRIIGKIAAGETFSGEVRAGSCVRLFTGSALPRGADAVVMQEDAQVESPAEIIVCEPVKAGENLRSRGEDVRKGNALGEVGDRIGPGPLGLFAAAGIARVKVGSRPGAGLLATGSELKEAGQTLEPGQIYESNRLMLAHLVRRAGALVRIFPLVPDSLGATRQSLERAFSECDVVISSGGASVGELDFIKQGFADAGGDLQFWKVAIRPGRPFVFGRWKGKLLFGLPGNPVSALVTFLLLVRPALLRWQGARDVSLPTHPGVLAEPLANPGNRRHFMRVRADSAGKVYSSGAQASHMLSSLALANGLVDVPPNTTLPMGHNVEVIRWE
jgi:molybdopterin molybdotransferase